MMGAICGMKTENGNTGNGKIAKRSLMKVFSIILCLLMCVVLLTACKGNDERGSSSGNSASESGPVSPAGQWRRGGADLIDLKSDGTFVWVSDNSNYDKTGTWDSQKISLDEGRWYDIVDSGKNIMRIRWRYDEKTETIYRTGSNALTGKWTLQETNGDRNAPSIFRTAGSMQENNATFTLEFRTDGLCSRTYSMMQGVNTSDGYSYGVEGNRLYMFSDGEEMSFQLDGNTLTLTEGSYMIKLTRAD